MEKIIQIIKTQPGSLWTDKDEGGVDGFAGERIEYGGYYFINGSNKFISV